MLDGPFISHVGDVMIAVTNELEDTGTCLGNLVELHCPRSRSFIAIYDVQITQQEGCVKNKSSGEVLCASLYILLNDFLAQMF